MLEYETPAQETDNQLSEPLGSTADTRSPISSRLWTKARFLVKKIDSRIPFSLVMQTLAFIFVMTWFVMLIPLRTSNINDFDLGWHLRSGEWIMQHHELPKTDPFSITGGTAPWVAYSWPFSVLIYELAKNFDFQGIAAYSTLVWFATVILLFIMIRGQGASFWRALGLTFVAGNIVPRVISPRPGTVTILLFILMFHILLRERQKGYTRALWTVPVIIWAWSNVHVQFVYGLFVLGLFCIEPILDWLFFKGEPKAWSARLWSVLAVSCASTLLNPYGFGSYQVLIDFLHQPLLAGYVVETSAMPFNVHVHYIVLLLALGAAYGLARRKPIRPLWVVLLLWTTFSAFKMERDIWLLTTIAAAFLATPLPESNRREEHISNRVWIYGTVGILLAVFFTIKVLPSNKFMAAMVANELPVGAVAYVHEHHLSGPLFNDYDWGGFLIYALPEIPVAMDGRTNVHGQDEVGRSINTWWLRPGWDHDPLLNNANLVIGTPKKALTSYLREDPHFKMVFDDGVAVVFKRVKPGRPGLIESPEASKTEKKP